MRIISRAATLGAAILIGTAAAAMPVQKTKAKPKTAVKKPVTTAHQTKGQGQLVGGNGQFGVVYSLRDGFNFEILSARYQLEPYVAYETLTAGTAEKLLVLDIAIKNIRTGDNFFNPDSMFTLVDSKGQIYNGGSLSLQSLGSASGSWNLRPGQGLGQPDLKDPVRIAWKLPAKARIVKIMVNKQRLGQNEEVFRYYVAGATKAEAGEVGDPKNVIQPLPESVRDPADPSGAIPLEEGKGAKGEFQPSGYFGIRLDDFGYTTDSLNGNPPEEGKKYAVATVTVKNLTDKTVGMFDAQGGDDPTYQITDSDGEREKPVFYRKAKRDEDPEHEFKQGDEYTFRVVFVLPKDATAKKLTIGTGQARKWAYDVSNVK